MLQRLVRPMLASTFVASITQAATSPITVDLKNAKGESVGTATLTEMTKGVRIVLDVKGLAPGEHAFHFHENGKCETPKFESAGSHFAPKKNPHGFMDAKGPHAGDMPNLIASADGTVKQEIINTNVTLKPGASSLLKKGGTAAVIHEKADDYKTQPTGDAGGRAVCGEITGA